MEPERVVDRAVELDAADFLIGETLSTLWGHTPAAWAPPTWRSPPHRSARSARLISMTPSELEVLETSVWAAEVVEAGLSDMQERFVSARPSL